jgi:hypothetical protein
MAGFDPNTLNQALAITGSAPVYGQSPGLSGGGQMDPATVARLKKMAEQNGMAAQAQFAEDIPGGSMSNGIAGPVGGEVAPPPVAAPPVDAQADTIKRAQDIVEGKSDGEALDPVAIERPEVESTEEKGAANQANAMNKMGSALGAIGNFYTGNWAGALQSAQGMIGKNQNAHDPKQQSSQSGGGANGMMSMLGGLFGKKG